MENHNYTTTKSPIWHCESSFSTPALEQQILWSSGPTIDFKCNMFFVFFCFIWDTQAFFFIMAPQVVLVTFMFTWHQNSDVICSQSERPAALCSRRTGHSTWRSVISSMRQKRGRVPTRKVCFQQHCSNSVWVMPDIQTSLTIPTKIVKLYVAVLFLLCCAQLLNHFFYGFSRLNEALNSKTK